MPVSDIFAEKMMTTTTKTQCNATQQNQFDILLCPICIYIHVLYMFANIKLKDRAQNHFIYYKHIVVEVTNTVQFV